MISSTKNIVRVFEKSKVAISCNVFVSNCGQLLLWRSNALMFFEKFIIIYFSSLSYRHFIKWTKNKKTYILRRERFKDKVTINSWYWMWIRSSVGCFHNMHHHFVSSVVLSVDRSCEIQTGSFFCNNLIMSYSVNKLQSRLFGCVA